jgi:predicted Zn-dependent protease
VLPDGDLITDGFRALVRILVYLAFLRSNQSQSGHKPSRRAASLRWLIVAFVALFMLLFLGAAAIGSKWLALMAFGASVAAMLVALIGVIFGAFRFGPDVLRGPIRRALAEAWAAASEGSTEEALETVKGKLGRYPDNPWLLASAAALLVDRGRLEEARRVLEKPLACEETRAHAMLSRAACDLLAGKHEESLAHLGELVEERPRDPVVHRLRGLAALAGGSLPEARRAFQAAADLKERDGAALAALALVELREHGVSAEAERLIEEASREEAGAPLVLFAAVCHAAARGDEEEEKEGLERLAERLRAEGKPGWVGFYECLADRWRRRDPCGAHLDLTRRALRTPTESTLE